MTNKYDQLKGMVEASLYHTKVKHTESELRSLIQNLAVAISQDFNDDELEKMAREIEATQGVRAGLGSIVDSDDFEPWLDDAKPLINPFYWERYRKFLTQQSLPKEVVLATDTVTDKILSRLGNPNQNNKWDRRGMVVGHVQSGKTANYTGLMTKAADAGYRLIIVIAGIHNNLRNQTQIRVDEGFIGRDTGKSQQNKKNGGGKYVIGVGQFDSNRTPVSLTNTLKDFNKATASTNTSEIDSYNVPVVLVIKKNYRTLNSLLEWLRDNNARGDLEMIDQPMLLIDDEADNASINTKYGKQLVTTINGQIRDLLNMFNRSSYIGYTATPFANIFVDPDQEDEMFDEDLFPRDFIIGLDAPTNYFGPGKIFIDGLPDQGEPTWLRNIDDNEDILPIKHRIDHDLTALPDSLVKGLRTFLLARTIRNCRGQSASHCSMLVNASRFTGIQGKLRNRLHEKLEAIKNSIRINASKGPTGMIEPEISALHAVWMEEYSSEAPDWAEIQAGLFESIAAAKVVEVNSNSNDLDYSDSGERGKTIIAVGGFSLSRGLTLEGLTVTWFLRNSLMYDTLMQMGRWFGYRTGYEDLCRIWMPVEAIEWYAFIANATEELHGELEAMDKARATPRMFGLAVRSHPASLLVTARNKMGSSQRVTVQVGLSNKFLETSRVSIKPDDLRHNLDLAKSFISELDQKKLVEKSTQFGTLIEDVPVELIDNFLAGWRNAVESASTEIGPVRNYIKVRVENELNKWDILIPSLKKGKENLKLGKSIVPTSRYVGLQDLKNHFMSFSGKRMRIASRGIEKSGISSQKAEDAEKSYRELNGLEDNEKLNYPDRIYRAVRNKGLFILFLVQATEPKSSSISKNSDKIALIPSDPVIAWGISFPFSSRQNERVEYVINTVRQGELFGEEDQDEDMTHEDE